MKAFKASYPADQAQAQFPVKNNPLASHANSSYFQVPTFKFIARNDKIRLMRLASDRSASR